jgi:hypothetical protein
MISVFLPTTGFGTMSYRDKGPANKTRKALWLKAWRIV